MNGQQDVQEFGKYIKSSTRLMGHWMPQLEPIRLGENLETACVAEVDRPQLAHAPDFTQN